MIILVQIASIIIFGACLFAWGYVLGVRIQHIRSVKEWRDYRNAFYSRVVHSS